ncbi:MAG: hypothetical protein JWO03_753 [Bacteroidetes bacterium]|nr:hypothetical protein [Bacteroidota bacterium]
MIFHIADPDQWAAASQTQPYKPEHFDREGFIHCSDATQVAGTLHKHYQMADRLLLLAIDSEAEKDHLKYEDFYRRGQQFPHIYRPLPVSSVRGTHLMERNNRGQFEIPHEWMKSFK